MFILRHLLALGAVLALSSAQALAAAIPAKEVRGFYPEPATNDPVSRPSGSQIS
jgi:hypothetical protein